MYLTILYIYLTHFIKASYFATVTETRTNMIDKVTR